MHLARRVQGLCRTYADRTGGLQEAPGLNMLPCQPGEFHAEDRLNTADPGRDGKSLSTRTYPMNTHRR